MPAVDATRLSAGQHVTLGRVVKKALLANPHGLVGALVESEQSAFTKSLPPKQVRVIAPHISSLVMSGWAWGTAGWERGRRHSRRAEAGSRCAHPMIRCAACPPRQRSGRS
jgi:hypothetical protein